MPGSSKKRARRLAKAAHDPLDETYVPPRAELASIPWNKLALTADGRESIAQALLDGYPRNEIARAMGATVATLRRLIKEDPMLRDAVDARKDIEEAELCDVLTANARAGDSAAAMFLLKARHGYRDKPELKVEDGAGGGVLVIPATVPLDQWSAAAARQQAEYRQRNPQTDPEAPGASALREAEQARHVRRQPSVGLEGLKLRKAEPRDLTH